VKANQGRNAAVYVIWENTFAAEGQRMRSSVRQMPKLYPFRPTNKLY